MQYLMAFVQKDRQSDSLVEKLCFRLRATTDERQWGNIAYCLGLLSYSERGIRKLAENFACYGDKLFDDEVHKGFVSILAKARKFSKPELRQFIDELEMRINACHNNGVQSAEVVDAATTMATPAAVRTAERAAAATASAIKSTARKATPGAGLRAKRIGGAKPAQPIFTAESGDSDADAFEDDAAPQAGRRAVPCPPAAAPPTRAASTAGRAPRGGASGRRAKGPVDAFLFDTDEENDDGADNTTIEPSDRDAPASRKPAAAKMALRAGKQQAAGTAARGRPRRRGHR